MSQYSKRKQAEQKKKRSERSRLSVMGVRDRHTLQAMSEARRREARQVRPDTVSALLLQWRLCDLVRHTKLLLILLNRRAYAPPERELHGVERLLYYRHHSEYYDTLFADYAELPWWNGEAFVALSFRQYYNAAYHAAKDYVARAALGGGAPCEEERAHHQRQLRVLFVCALVHDERVRRFVMAHHDLTTQLMGTSPPCQRRVAHFCDAVRAQVNALFHGAVEFDALHTITLDAWDRWYMRRGAEHTVQTPSCGENTMELIM